MSESTSAPAGPAEGGGESSPPPASQPAISVSEAARLLSQQRRQQGAPESTAPERRPAPNDATIEILRKYGIAGLMAGGAGAAATQQPSQ